MSKEYPGLLHCYRCGAHYRGGGWWLARHAPGTTGRVHWVRDIDDNLCPICLEPPLLTKPTEQVGAM